MSARRAAAAGLALALLAGLGGCGGAPAGGDPAGGPRGRVTVLAAASLTEAFTRIGAAFEAAHPGTDVVFSFGGSSGLARQINAGAPGDVFAAASVEAMAQIGDDAAGPARVFARNRVVIAVPRGNPHRVAALADLVRPGMKVAMCAAQVPCGAAAHRALRNAHVALTPVTEEQDVRAALMRLRLGTVDAALVYRTDVLAAGAEVAGVEVPEAAGTVTDYPIVALRGAPNRAGADALVAWVGSAGARAVLAEAGFALP